MKFSKVGSSGFGSAHTPITMDELLMIDKGQLEYFNVLRPSIKDALSFEQDKRQKVDMMWYYIVGFRGSEVLQFHLNQEYYIDYDGNPATGQQLTDVINDSFKHLQRSYESVKEDYPIFLSAD
jgi:hypothetical protein